MIYKLSTVMGHVGHAVPETERWDILDLLGVDVELAKKAVCKLYFEEVYHNATFETYHTVFFIPNETKHGTAFAMKYGTMMNE